MNGRRRLDAMDTAPSDNIFDHLSLATRLWIAFRAGVTRRLDLLPISGSAVRAVFEAHQSPGHDG